MRIYLTVSGSGQVVHVGYAENLEAATALVAHLDEQFQILTHPKNATKEMFQEFRDQDNPFAYWEGADLYAEENGKTYVLDSSDENPINWTWDEIGL